MTFHLGGCRLDEVRWDHPCSGPTYKFMSLTGRSVSLFRNQTHMVKLQPNGEGGGRIPTPLLSLQTPRTPAENQTHASPTASQSSEETSTPALSRRSSTWVDRGSGWTDDLSVFSPWKALSKQRRDLNPPPSGSRYTGSVGTAPACFCLL